MLKSEFLGLVKAYRYMDIIYDLIREDINPVLFFLFLTVIILETF